MQIIEKEIGRAVSSYFGELVCMADTEDNPCFWAIKKKMDFFNIKDNEMIIALNLYCYNRRFVSTYSDTETESINKDVKDTYDKFLNDCSNIDEVFTREFNAEKEDWGIGEGIDTEEAIKDAVKIVRIEVLKKRYHIIFILDGEEWALSKNTKTDTWSLMPAAEVRPAEMDYSN
ncbi:MAG: hypothetical protein J6X94_08715 [Lachnospiraceae bacterium]|nr:hypothetical protein [Lachnospiraceae bacterium]